MTSVQAWLLDLGPYRIAVAYHDVVEVLMEPKAWPMPVGPRWCREILSWRGRYLPLARLGMLNDSGYAVVVVGQQKPGQAPDYVSLRLKQPPRMVVVTDADDCEPPDNVVFPHEHLLACFKFEDEAIAVPDIASLFSLKLEETKPVAA